MTATVPWRGTSFAVLILTTTTAAHADDELPPLSVYGMVRLDAILADERLSDLESPRYVAADTGRAGSELSLHPRLTRFGLTMDPFDVNTHAEAQGRIEVDFQDSDVDKTADGRDAVRLRLRHAYASVLFDRRVELLAGQTWDLASPLHPSVNSDSMMWDAGNTGGFRPQLRLTYLPSDRMRLAIAAGATGVNDGQDADGDGRLDGVASGRPTWQFLAEYRRRVLGPEPTRFGVWATSAREQLGDGQRVRSYAAGGHVVMAIDDRARISLEVFRGRNLDDLHGGIGQGYDARLGRGVDSGGGWAETEVAITSRHWIAAGGSVDTTSRGDVGPRGRTVNATIFSSVRYRPRESVQIGLEYIRWMTTYRDTRTGTANRWNLHGTLFF